MSDRYPGGIISATEPEPVGPTGGEGGSAPGIWTLEQASYYEGIDQWPKPILDKELYSWGYNLYGQLGQNDIVSRSSPVQVGSLVTWGEVASGQQARNSGAIKTDGTLWLWGDGIYGALGTNDTTTRSSPVQVGALTTWSQVSIGNGWTGAVKTDGTLWTWGLGATGRTGHNDQVSRSSPVQVGSLTTWYKVSAEGFWGLAVKTDGTMWSWGSNINGRCGIGTAHPDNRSSPTQIGALTTWLDISAGTYGGGALKNDGTIWMWGSGALGRIGANNTGINYSSPVQIGALTTWNKLSNAHYNSGAIKNDGTLWVWGSGFVGQLGQNNTIDHSSPVQVGALNTWLDVSVGRYRYNVIKTDGTLWVWGDNFYDGSLGTNDTVFRSSPVQLGGLSTWSKVGAGQSSTLAITKG